MIFQISLMPYGLDLGELIQQYIWLFWLVHTYNSTQFGQPSPCDPSLMYWSATSLICGALVWLSVLGVYLAYFSSPRSIYYHLEHLTFLYLLTHTCLGVFNAPTHFTNVNTLVRDCLGWVGSPLVHLREIEVKSHHDTCTTPISFQSLMNLFNALKICIIHIFKVCYNIMVWY